MWNHFLIQQIYSCYLQLSRNNRYDIIRNQKFKWLSLDNTKSHFYFTKGITLLSLSLIDFFWSTSTVGKAYIAILLQIKVIYTRYKIWGREGERGSLVYSWPIQYLTETVNEGFIRWQLNNISILNISLLTSITRVRVVAWL